MLGLGIAYLHTKVDNSSFRRSRDMVGTHQNVNGSRDLQTSPFRDVCNLCINTCYDQPIPTNSEVSVSNSTDYENMKSDTKCPKWFWVVLGYSRSLEIAPFDRAHTPFY